MSKKQRKPEEMSIRSYLEHKYLAYCLKYVSICTSGEKEVFNEQAAIYSKYYDSCIEEIANYMARTFTIEKLNNGNKEFSFEDFKDQVNPNIISFLTNRYLFSGTVFLDSRISKAHFIVKDSIIEKAKNLEDFFRIKTNHVLLEDISNVFVGKSLLDAYHTLKDYGFLPKQGELQKTAEMIEKSDSLTDDFINAACIYLILQGSSYDLARAKIFAEAFGATFDFSQLSVENFMGLTYKTKVS